MYDYRIVEQVSRKKKHMSGALRKVMVRLLRKRMQHILDAVSFLTSSPEQEENPVPTMPMQSTLQEFAGFLMITMLLSRQQSLERLILAEAEPSLILRHFTEWRLSTVAWQC